MFDFLGTLVSRRWITVLLGWTLLTGLVHLFAPRWEDVAHDGDLAFLPQGMPSVQGEKLLQAAFPGVRAKSQIILLVARTDGVLCGEDYAIANRLVEEYTPTEEENQPILEVLSHQSEVVGKKLVSQVGPNGQALLIILQLRNEFMAVGNVGLVSKIQQQLDRLRHEAGFPAGLQLAMTGSTAIGSDIFMSGEESIRNTERATILLVVVILLLVYRAPGLVVIPLITIFVSLAVSMGLAAELARLCEQSGWLDFKIFTTTKIFVVVILFGAGTDFCLFLISRYKEELQHGRQPSEAVAEALGRVGGAIGASAITTVLGLGVMAFSDFGKFRDSGPVIAICLLVALAASVTLAPAILRMTGPAVFWPFGVSSPQTRSDKRHSVYPSDESETDTTVFRGLWERLSKQIIIRPGLILAGSLLLLAPLAWHGLSVEVTYDLLGGLQPDRPSVVGTRLFEEYFPAGETGPITILVLDEKGGLEASASQRQRIASLSRSLYGLKYCDSRGKLTQPITSVRSLVEPLGERSKQHGLLGSVRKSVLRSQRETKDLYLATSPEYAGRVIRLDVVTAFDPFSRESIRFLDALNSHLQSLSETPETDWHEAEFYCIGPTASIRDLRTVTASDLVLIQRLVTIAVLAVLIVILRRPLVSVYLILSVLLGYFVTLGTTSLYFAWLYGEKFNGLDWTVPVFLFVILVAVGEDYNIYLVTRVYEEQRRRGAVEGLRVALIRTGGIITSCGVIMAGTFASMLAGTLRAVNELGLALTLGVLLDTFVIRTILVPAFLMLWNQHVLSRRSASHCEAELRAESSATMTGFPGQSHAASSCKLVQQGEESRRPRNP